MQLMIDQFRSAYPFQRMFPFYCLFETGSLQQPEAGRKSDPEMEKIFKVLEKGSDFILVS